MIRNILFATLGVFLMACTSGRDLDKPMAPLGDFKLGFTAVVAPDPYKGPLSRDATKDELIAAVDTALKDRFSRYQGDRFYHLGVSVDGYVLARTGIPLVLAPKSALIVNVTVWDDEKKERLNMEPFQITSLEGLSGKTVIGSGLTQSKEKQLENLAIVTAKHVEEWLVKMSNTEGWFGVTPSPAKTTAKIAR